MGTSNSLNLLNLFNFFVFKTENFHLTPENRAWTAKLRVPLDSAGKNTSNYVLWISGKIFFGEAVRHSSKLFVVKKGDKNLS